MNTEQREKIIKLCKDHIEEHGNVRVGWAAKEIIGTEQENHIKDKIAALIIQTGEYVKEPSRKFELDWNVRKNPNYKKEKWTTKRPILFELFKGFVTACFSIIVSVIISVTIVNRSDNRKDEPELIQKSDSISNLNKQINLKDTLNKSLN